MKFRIFLVLAVLGVFNTTTKAQIDISGLRSLENTYALSETETVNIGSLSTIKNNYFGPFTDAFIIHRTLHDLDYRVSKSPYSKEGNSASIFLYRRDKLSYRTNYPHFLTSLKTSNFQFNMAFVADSEMLIYSKRNLIYKDKSAYTDVDKQHRPYGNTIKTPSKEDLDPWNFSSLFNKTL